MPDNLTAYIRSSLSQGIPTETIEANLLQSGWSKEKIDQSLLKTNYKPPSRSGNEVTLFSKYRLLIIVVLVALLLGSAFLYLQDQINFNRGGPTDNLPTGVFYYKTPNSNELKLSRLHSDGREEKVDLPKDCSNPIPSWDKVKVFCGVRLIDDPRKDTQYYIINTETGEEKSFPASTVGLRKPSDLWGWSRDGKKLLFGSNDFIKYLDYLELKRTGDDKVYRNKSQIQDYKSVYLLDTETLRVSKIYREKTESDILFASFSPDGKNVAIVSSLDKSVGPYEDVRSKLVILNLGTKRTKTLNSVKDCAKYKFKENLSQNKKLPLCETRGVQWSDDGKKIFYYTQRIEFGKKVLDRFEETVKSTTYRFILAGINNNDKKSIEKSFEKAYKDSSVNNDLKMSIFNGINDFFFVINRSVQKVNLNSGKSKVLKPYTFGSQAYFSLDGKWIGYINYISGRRGVWLEETEGKRKLRILNSTEWSLGKSSNPDYLYWFY